MGERYTGTFKPGDGGTIVIVLVWSKPALLIAFSNRRACLRTPGVARSYSVSSRAARHENQPIYFARRTAGLAATSSSGASLRRTGVYALQSSVVTHRITALTYVPTSANKADGRSYQSASIAAARSQRQRLGIAAEPGARRSDGDEDPAGLQELQRVLDMRDTLLISKGRVHYGKLAPPHSMTSSARASSD